MIEPDRPLPAEIERHQAPWWLDWAVTLLIAVLMSWVCLIGLGFFGRLMFEAAKVGWNAFGRWFGL